MEYFICSTSVFDNIYKNNTLIEKDVPGGAGLYALVGASLWSDNVNLVCGVGNDYKDKMTDWYERNNLNMNYLRIENNPTPLNNIYYKKEEDRIEIPEYGSEHYKLFETKKEEFSSLINKEVGIYVFRDANSDFWGDFIKLKNKKAYILWEIAANSCVPSDLNKVNRILEKIDVFSINFEEASSLFGTNNYDDVIENLKKLNVKKIFLRLGKKGQVFIVDKKSIFIPSKKTDSVVETTGGGNSSSGAVLVGFSNQCSIEKIGDMANSSAILCLSQVGIPKKIK